MTTIQLLEAAVSSSTSRQQEGQNYHDFVTELKKLSSECEFDNFQDSLMRDCM